MRQRILEESEKEIFKKGIFELDESYFGAKRVRGKRRGELRSKRE